MAKRYCLGAGIGSSGVVVLTVGSQGLTITDFDVTVLDGSGSGTVNIGYATSVVGGTPWQFLPLREQDPAALSSALAIPTSFSARVGLSLGWALIAPTAGPVKLLRYPIVAAPGSQLYIEAGLAIQMNLYVEE